MINMKFDWQSRIRNKTFWLALSSAIILLTQQLGLDVFPSNITEIINTILLIATILGIVVDPTTEGISDKIKEEK